MSTASRGLRAPDAPTGAVVRVRSLGHAGSVSSASPGAQAIGWASRERRSWERESAEQLFRTQAPAVLDRISDAIEEPNARSKPNSMQMEDFHSSIIILA